MLEELLRERPEGCISDLSLDAWRAGELDSRTVAELSEHVAHCETCRARRATLARDASDFLVRFPDLNARLPRRNDIKKRALRRWPWAGAVVVAAAAVALVTRIPQSGRASGEGSRTKGSARFGFYVKQNGRIFSGVDGQEVHPGDRLRFFVSAPGQQELAILSRDGAGIVSEYYPGTGHGRTVTGQREEVLESSVELDSTLGEEQLWAIMCDAPFATEPLLRALETKRSLTAPANCTLDRLTIVKRANP